MFKFEKQLEKSAVTVAASADGNPVLAVLTVALFYLFFNMLEAGIERLVFGERFLHWLDPFIAIIFMGYSGYTVWACAALNLSRRRNEESA